MIEFYSISQFSGLTGTTKRTLQYYDDIGLLKPMKSDNGYRKYTNNDLLTLQQILTLKYLGLSVSKIKKLLEQDKREVEHVLETQVQSLKSRARVLMKTANLLEDILLLKKYAEQLDWSLIAGAIRALHSDSEEEWFQKFYTEQELAHLYSIWRGFSDNEVADYVAAYSALVDTIKANLQLSPCHSLSQSIAFKFYDMAKECYGSVPGLMKKILITYRVGMLATDFIPLLEGKAFKYLVESLAEAKKIQEFC